MTQTISVPMQDIPKPLSLSDAVGKWTDINNAQQRGQLAQQQETRLADQNQRENKMGELKFNITQQAGLKDAMTSYKSALQSQAAKLGIQPNTPQYQQLANATYHNGGYDKLVQNMGGHAHDPKTDIDLSAVDAVAGMTLAEQNAADIQQKVAESNALLPNKVAVAEAMSGINAKQDERKFQQSKELAKMSNDYQEGRDTQQHQWKIDEQMEMDSEAPHLSEGAKMNIARDWNNGKDVPRNLPKKDLADIYTYADGIKTGAIPEDTIRAQMAADRREAVGQAASLKTQVAQENQIKNMERLFDFNRGKLSDLAKSLNNDTSPVIQAWLQTGARSTNMSPEDAKKLAAFDVYKNEVDNEYAKITSGSASGAGVIAQSEREHVRKLIQSANTLGQMQAALDAMGQSSRARMETLQKTKAETMAKLGANSNGQQQSPQAEQAPPAGTRKATDANGNVVYVRVK